MCKLIIDKDLAELLEEVDNYRKKSHYLMAFYFVKIFILD
jgi:hypothetical protein